ncbi:hypothetical protein ACFL6I_13080 [candidate division KSB1 bacterium]
MSHEITVMHGIASISSRVNPTATSTCLVFTSQEFSFGEGRLIKGAGRGALNIVEEVGHPFVGDLLRLGFTMSIVADTFAVVGIDPEDEKETLRVVSEVLEKHFSNGVDFLDVGDGGGVLLMGKIAFLPNKAA